MHNKEEIKDEVKIETLNLNECQVGIESLPREIVEKVIKYVDISEIKALRQMNKNFKQIIDSFDYVWIKKLRINMKIGKKIDIVHIDRLLNHLDYLNDVHFKCNGFINLKRAGLKIDTPQDFYNARVETLTLEDFFVEMMSLANLFPNSLKTLSIKYFNQELISDILEDHEHEVDIPKFNLPQLQSLMFTFKNDGNPGCKCECRNFNIGNIQATLAQKLLKQSKIFRDKLKVLTINNFFAELFILHETLEDLNLDTLVINDATSIDELNGMDDIEDRKFRARKLTLRCSIHVAYLILFHSIDLNSIEELNIFISKNKSNFLFNDEMMIFNMISNLNGKLPNLKKFSSNSAQNFMPSLKFKFPINLTDACFMEISSIGDLVDFIKAFLYKYKSLERLGFCIQAKCNKIGNDYCKQKEERLKKVFNWIKKVFPKLKEIVFHLYCPSCDDGDDNDEKPEDCMTKDEIVISMDANINNFKYKSLFY